MVENDKAKAAQVIGANYKKIEKLCTFNPLFWTFLDLDDRNRTTV